MKETVIFFVAMGFVTLVHAELVSKTLPPEAEVPAHCAAVYGALLKGADNPTKQAYYFAKSKVMVDQAVVETESRGVSREQARLFTSNLLNQILETEKNNNSLYQTLIKQEVETCETFDAYRKTHQR